jgi:lipopolysaccharide/colanic/teichoic acid biosynthesis glycosyltransferase
VDTEAMSLGSAAEIAVPASESEPGVVGRTPADLGVLPATELAGIRRSARQILSGAAIRVLDVFVAALLLVVLLPLMVLIAIAIRVESAGPAFFRCERVGYRGRRLRMLKLRKMSHGAQGCSLTTHADTRFTRLGGLLSGLKIDEIPQLWHVLCGTMSLVGPRPECAEFVDLHRREYAEILTVRPGMTGLSQIAFVDERRILDPDDPVADYINRILPQKVALDMMYANRRTLSFNLRILFWTAVTLLMRREVAVHRDSGKMNIRRR